MSGDRSEPGVPIAVVSVPVPLEDLFRTHEVRHKRVPAPRLSRRKVVPPDLLLFVLIDPRAEGFCDQLRAEAYAQNGHTRSHCITDRLHLTREIRVSADLVHIHRAPEHYKAVIALET